MPSNKPDDMRDDHPFTPRQIHELDERLAKVDQRFDKVDQRFAKVDERFDKVDQRFDKVDQHFDRIDQRFAEERAERRTEVQTLQRELRADFAHDIGVAMGTVFEQWRDAMRGDLLQALGVTLEDFERSQRLAIEPVAARVETIENDNLPERVTKLEAKVFPPAKPARRRRG